MAQIGRKPKSKEQHLAEGTYQPSRHDGRGVDGVEGELVAPDYFDEDQVAAWSDIHGMCSAWVTLSDAACLEAAAIALALGRKANEDLKTQGRYQESRNGKTVSPAVRLLRGAFSDLKGYFPLLGLSPADRVRLTLGDDSGGGDSSFQGEMLSLVGAGLKPVA